MFRWGTKVREIVFNEPFSTSLPVPGEAYLMVEILFRIRKVLGETLHYCQNPSTRLNFIPNSAKNKLKQRALAAAKSNEGRVMRRAMDMLVRSTPMSPAYDSFVKAGRAANQKRRGAKQSQKSIPRGPDISMCVGKFMMAGIDTFDQVAMGACIPDGNVTSSVRTFAKQQLVVTIGTLGYGFCHFFTPLASDAVSSVTTTAAFTGSNCSWLSANNTLLPGVVVHTLPTAFDQGDLITGVGNNDDKPAAASRMVAAGFSVRYTGTEVDRSGQIYVFTNPTHESALSHLSVSGVESVNSEAYFARNLETFIVESSRSDCHFPLFPVNEDEMMYSSDAYTQGGSLGTAIVYPWSRGASLQPGGFTYSAGGYNVGIATTTLFIVGTAGTTYTVNYGQHQEAVGPAVHAFSKSPSESDPVGVRDILGASTHFQLNRARVPGLDPKREFLAAIKEIQSSRARRFRL